LTSPRQSLASTSSCNFFKSFTHLLGFSRYRVWPCNHAESLDQTIKEEVLIAQQPNYVYF